MDKPGVFGLDNVTKSYGGKTVLDGVSAEFADGGRYYLSGPSGCGKTTFLHILMGIVTPDTGRVYGMGGANTMNQKTYERSAAPVFQEDRLCENMSVGANIRLTSRGKPTAARIEGQLERLALGGALHTPVNHLSGGMKRRVALARALLSGGELLILDEPFIELDDETKLCALAEVEHALAGGRRTLILVSHDRRDAARLGCAELNLFG